jgi:sugar phosphate permease
VHDQRRWTILAVGTFAQAATCAFLYGIPMLVPAFRAEGTSLFGASLLVAAPMLGLLLTLIAWGATADRYGERVVIVTGVGIAAAVLGVAAFVPGVVALGLLFVLAGAFAASVNAASGRVVMGWFPVTERGLAMGTRQTAQPLGVALAALGLPALAHAHGAHHALLFPAVLCAAAAALVLLLVTDPPRPARSASAPPAASPYRGSSDLVRVHLASAMLVVPQFAVSAFTLIYLVGERSWDPATAGRLVFGFQLVGAVGRVVTGVWSDRVGSRLRPMRAIAVGAATGSVVVVLAFAIASVVTVADNGLAYVAVAEFAGREWSGRALGAQNTVQNFAAIVTAPLMAAAIGDTRYALGFALVAVCPVLAVPVTPVRAERRRRSAGEDVAGADVVASEVG